MFLGSLSNIHKGKKKSFASSFPQKGDPKMLHHHEKLAKILNKWRGKAGSIVYLYQHSYTKTHMARNDYYPQVINPMQANGYKMKSNIKYGKLNILILVTFRKKINWDQ
jgi:hypothetical protein